MAGKLIQVRGIVQKEGIVIHVVSEHLEDLGAELGHLTLPLARADEVTRPGQDVRTLATRSRDFH
jgi:error-prone DNA polymerase